MPAGLRRPRRAADRSVPQPPRAGPRQQSQDPQRKARRDPLALPILGAAPSRARRHDRPRDRDPDQTPPANHDLLPRPPRDRRVARSARPGHVARTARPRDAPHSDPDRRARLRTREPHDRKPGARCRGAHLRVLGPGRTGDGAAIACSSCLSDAGSVRPGSCAAPGREVLVRCPPGWCGRWLWGTTSREAYCSAAITTSARP